MNFRNHLYIVRHQIEGESIAAPCVGDEEVIIHSRIAEHAGGRLESICCLESELKTWLEICYTEGYLKGWLPNPPPPPYA